MLRFASALVSLVVVAASVAAGCSFDFESQGSPIAYCPGSAPAAGSACDTTLRCEFGTDPRPECRDTFACQNAKWVVATPACAQCPLGGSGAGCMEDNPPLCSGSDILICRTSEGGNSYWGCAGTTAIEVNPPTDTTCPAVAPGTGQNCSAPAGTKCQYGDCLLGTRIFRTCTGGLWKDAAVDCMPAQSTACL